MQSVPADYPSTGSNPNPQPPTSTSKLPVYGSDPGHPSHLRGAPPEDHGPRDAAAQPVHQPVEGGLRRDQRGVQVQTVAHGVVAAWHHITSHQITSHQELKKNKNSPGMCTRVGVGSVSLSGERPAGGRSVFTRYGEAGQRDVPQRLR